MLTVYTAATVMTTWSAAALVAVMGLRSMAKPAMTRWRVGLTLTIWMAVRVAVTG